MGGVKNYCHRLSVTNPQNLKKKKKKISIVNEYRDKYHMI